MAKDDWFRRKTWTDQDRAEFHARLARSRDPFHKAQYARIQACYLQGIGTPELVRAADELLDDVIARWPDQSQLALAYHQKAECALMLQGVEQALDWLRKALQQEQVFPNSVTFAGLLLAKLVVVNHLTEHYDEVLAILQKRAANLTWPIERFYVYGLSAIISSERGQDEEARNHAALALDAAAQKHSGFRYHPTMGLVATPEPSIQERLVRITGREA
jgi:tetratricopeptide (TPR) repeat protein